MYLGAAQVKRYEKKSSRITRADHGRSPAVFQPRHEVRINEARVEELTIEQREAFCRSHPRRVFELDSRTKRIVVNREVLRRVDCFDGPKSMSDSFKLSPEDEPVFTYWEVPGVFDFTVETNGALRPEELVEQALEIFSEKLLNVRSSLDTFMSGA